MCLTVSIEIDARLLPLRRQPVYSESTRLRLPQQARGFTRHFLNRVQGAFLTKRATIGDPLRKSLWGSLSQFGVSLATATERLTLGATRHDGAVVCHGDVAKPGEPLGS